MRGKGKLLRGRFAKDGLAVNDAGDNWMNCPKCGLSVDAGSSFCNHCGAALNDQGKTINSAAGAAVPTGGAPLAAAGTPIISPDILSQNVATAGEVVLWNEFPSLRTIFPRMAAVAVLFLLAFIGTRILLPLDRHPQWNGHDVLEWGLTLAALVLLLLILLGSLVRLRSVNYKLTTQRIFIEHGIFSKRTDEIELEKYKDVFVNQDFWDKMVGCGDIQVITGDVTNPTVNIIDITDPIAKKEAIRKAARERQLALGLRVREQM